MRISKKGFTFIEVLIGTSLSLVVFLGIFGAYQLGLKVIGQSERKISATAIANQWVEQIRNLPYDSIGTKDAVLPFAEGVLDSATTTTLNNVDYSVAIEIKYVSDSADGTTGDDTCDLDYKKAQIEVSWPGRFSGEIKLITDIAPPNKLLEISSCTSQPGGLLSVSVFDAFGSMVSAPLIEIFNPDTEELVDSYSPASGSYDFPLATSTYKVVVSKSGYSTQRTYGTDEVATPQKPNPSILENQVTQISFSIDELASFSIDTLSPWGRSFFADSFSDTSGLFQTENVVVSGGDISLATDTEGYVSLGSIRSVSVSPSSLLNWEELTFSDTEPLNTDIKYQFYYASDTDWYLVPNEDLSGNSAGFDVSPVDLSGLSSASYPSLRINGLLTSSATDSTPVIEDWQLSWITSEAVPIANTPIALRGDKIIGTDEEEDPVYKYSTSFTSNASGQITVSDLEWDLYTFSPGAGSSLDLTDTDPSPQPISLSPDTNTAVDLFLEADNSLLLTIQDLDDLTPVFSASTTVVNAGLSYETQQFTDANGQTLYIPLEAATYNIYVEAAGYLATSTSGFVSGDITKTVKLQKVE